MKTAPELDVTEWLNTTEPLNLQKLRGKVVVIEAFQMLCPGCVSHSLPQAIKIAQLFPQKDVQVIGLHTVFEHHAAQGSREALEAFIHEYKIPFPVAIDRQTDKHLPATMETYQMQGTPTLILVDKEGRLRKQKFGMTNDMQIGAEIMSLIGENSAPEPETENSPPQAGTCTDEGCSI
ncbi:redoxin family protein [Kordiimonas laminariae]|uniref:redoxin family protein n=1 Tax=Kordiimonas laminariae TaxID=2917717 RepID=UPI001FF31C4B|nr:redoxin family protein [Kordiimonas laminariae]MCK0070068.1 redoxin family protein [Kordiimonas laminariae]